MPQRSSNTIAPPAAAQASGAKRGTKRKSTEAALPNAAAGDGGNNENPDSVLFPPALAAISDEDPRLRKFSAEECALVRRWIRDWVASGAQTAQELQRELRVSSKDYADFMRRTNAWEGDQCETYWRAHLFFAKRRLLELPLAPPKPKKAKTAAARSTSESRPPAADKDLEARVAKLLDTCDDIVLPGEGTEYGVPVYDTPAEIRKKFRALQATEGVTKSAFMRALSKMIPDQGSVSAQNLKTFMAQVGVMDGNTSKSFYAGYLLFEKQRIRDGKPKSAFRLEMEKRHGPEGVDRTHNLKTTSFTVMRGEEIHINKWGQVEIH